MSGPAGGALERVQTAARRAGGAWNRHDKSSLRDALEVARELDLPDVKLEYGGLRFRFDLRPGGGAATTAVTAEQQAGDGDERVEVDMTSGVSAPPPAPAPGVPTATAPQFADARGSTVEAAADHARLREKEAVAQERRRRQKAARKVREAAAREAIAKYAELPYGDVETPMKKVRCELWSTTVDLKMALTKLVGEVTQRCATEGARAGLSTKACQILFSGQRYEMTVLSGTAVLEMAQTERTTDLLMLINYGLTTERLATLLRRWSKRAAPVTAG
tara:strand:- start:19 stop:846 length:828 start_codon:yes stop_codon:yes gene_type:complete